MSLADRPPSADELAAMAYVDGELGPEESARIEERLDREPALLREVAAQQRLAVLARASAPREPIDREWRKSQLSVTSSVTTPYGHRCLHWPTT